MEMEKSCNHDPVKLLLLANHPSRYLQYLQFLLKAVCKNVEIKVFHVSSVINTLNDTDTLSRKDDM